MGAGDETNEQGIRTVCLEHSGIKTSLKSLDGKLDDLGKDIKEIKAAMIIKQDQKEENKRLEDKINSLSARLWTTMISVALMIAGWLFQLLSK